MWSTLLLQVYWRSSYFGALWLKAQESIVVFVPFLAIIGPRFAAWYGRGLMAHYPGRFGMDVGTEVDRYLYAYLLSEDEVTYIVTGCIAVFIIVSIEVLIIVVKVIFAAAFPASDIL